MAQSHSDQIRLELDELRKSIEAARRDLGIGNGQRAPVNGKRTAGLLRRRRARRRVPVA